MRIPASTLIVLLLALPDFARACAVCMGGNDSNLAPAMNGAIFMMLGCIGTILVSLIAFIIYIARRASRATGAASDALNIIPKTESHA